MAIHTAIVTQNTTNLISVPQVALEQTWSVVNTVASKYLHHVRNIKSEITRRMPELKIGTHYRFTFTIFDLVSCSVQFKIGGAKYGNIYTTAGTKTEYFTIESEEDQAITFIANGVVKISAINYEEKVFITEPIPFSDVDKFENKSWTKSFSFHTNLWTSHHSYLPNYYLYNQNTLYMAFADGDNKIWKQLEEGDYTVFRGIKYPWIIDYVPKADIQSKVFEEISFLTRARKYDTTAKRYVDINYVTFNKICVYNNRQSTGEMDVIVKETQLDKQAWYQQQIVNKIGTILTTRKDRNWNINRFRDNVIDYDKPLFLSDWDSIKFMYPIDKIQNNSVVSFTKAWHQLQSFRDKYVVIRLKFDIFNDVNLLLNYSVETEVPSYR